ncbi:hypothetical protein SEUCBS139899_007902 [Sporothrix eucalyptigena]|uniref:AAA protein C-terminal winged helix domain-containing protein n=1 Tax=Sporothrix eucalyptigena TaxID=1812306 RepID=A0ABP0CFN1_9PEZI
MRSLVLSGVRLTHAQAALGARCSLPIVARHGASKASQIAREPWSARALYFSTDDAPSPRGGRSRRRSQLSRYYPLLSVKSSLPENDKSKGDAQRRGQGSSSTGGGNGGSGSGSESTIWQKMLESAATSFASIVMVGIGFGIAGYGYHHYYKNLVLRKMNIAFEPGDPVLELAAMGRDVPKHIAGGALDPQYVHTPRMGARNMLAEEADDKTANDDDIEDSDDGDDGRGNYWIRRPEQQLVNAIVAGWLIGHYHLFIGEKGTGKSSMQLDAMARIDAEGVAMFDAHADLEIFRIRLGKALNYEFNEDYIGSYFSERGPRDTTALLDIERALNKLEKVALQRRNATRPGLRRRPLVIIINQMHLIRDDEDGRDLIELLQQRAEQWAASGLVTMVFNSDDYWVYERFKQLAARLEVHSIQDLSRHQAMVTLKRYRWRHFGERVHDDLASHIYDLVGGRLTFLNRVVRSRDMFRTCRQIMEAEKQWFLSQCWVLGGEMDDDVMDQQKWAAAAMVLAQALVDKEAEELESKRQEAADAANAADAAKKTGSKRALARLDEMPQRTWLPSFELHEAQQIMTRADFIREMDRRNLFTIDSRAQVRASSVPMQWALREICSMPGFRDHLDATVQRIADIESLGRTRELVAKDLVLGGNYELSTIAVPSSKKDEGSGSGKKTEVRFRGWSPHERPPRDPPEPSDCDTT